MKKIYFPILLFIITLFSLTVNAQEFFENGKNLYSDNVYMVNLDTGNVVYELDSDELVYPASLTKIMTCILAIEHAESLDEMVTIPSGIFDDIYADGGANMALKAGEEISVGDLVRATMIRSACDSASALAWYVSGSIEDFAKLMNAKALEIGASNTHFVNAHGLHHYNHYTTAKDLYLIANYALQNEVFCDIIKEYSCTIPATNKSEERVFSSTIEIEIPDSEKYYRYVTGIKSGYTDEAGRCLITKATKDGESYLLVTLGANRDRYYNDNMAFTDAVTLFEYYFAEYSVSNILSSETVLGEIAVKKGTVDSVELKAQNSIEALVAIGDRPQITLNTPQSINAPIKAGEIVGTVTVEIGGESFEENLLAALSIEKKSDKKALSDFNNGNMAATVLDITSILLLSVAIIVLAIFLTKISRKRK